MLRKYDLRLLIQNAERSKPKPSLFATLKDIAPIFTGIGTLALSAVSFYFVHSLDRERAAVAAVELRQKAIAEYAEADPEKRDIGAMALASYGQAAFPALRMLLSGNSETQAYGIKVARYLFSEGAVETRSQLVTELTVWARSPSRLLRIGSYACFEKIADDLSKPEKRGLLALLNDRFNSDGRVAETDPEAGRSVCLMLNNFAWAEGRKILMSIVLTHSDRNIKTQAVESISTVGSKLSPNDRSVFLKDLKVLVEKSTADSTLNERLKKILAAEEAKSVKPSA